MGSALLVTGVVSATAAALAGEATPEKPIQVASGHLDWRYDKDPRDDAPEPTVVVSDGATKSADGTLRFPAGEGEYDPARGAAAVTYRGTAVFTYPGHRTVTLKNPVVDISTTGATVKADVGAATTAGILDLRTIGIPPVVSGTKVTWSEVSAGLTPAGEQALGADGADDDEVTIVLTLKSQAPPRLKNNAVRATTTSPTNSPTNSPSTTPTGCPTTTPTASPTTTPTTTPSTTPTDCPSESPSESPSTTPSPTNSGSTPHQSNLPKTGSAFLIPLMLTGGAMVTTGGGALIVARRRPRVRE